MKHNFVIGKYTLESLTDGMYALPLDLYREYVQNAVDSIDMAKILKISDKETFTIKIEIDRAQSRIYIHDNGCGIPALEAGSTLIDIGNSKKTD